MFPRLMLALAASALLFIAHDAVATAQRTFVASYGLTVNTAFNCSIVKPCRAFSEAIGVTTSGGEVIALDSAGYGPVTVTSSVSIIAPTGIYAGISVFGGDGITVNAPGAIVVLRGLSINGQPGSQRGIFLQAAARLRIENCVVSGMSVAGISHTAAGAEMIVLDTIVRDNGGSGIVVFGDLPSAVLDHVRSEHNGGDGLSFSPTSGSLGARATVVDSVFTHNEGNGIGAGSDSGATITLVVERSVMASNGQNGFVANIPVGAAGVATVSRSVINDNGGDGLSLLGAGSIYGAAVENVVHRNSGNGISLTGTSPGLSFVLVKGNASTASVGFDFQCDSPGNVHTDKSNAFNVPANSCGIGDISF